MNVACFPFGPENMSAIHEAGHAVFCIALGRALTKISLIGDLEGDASAEHTAKHSTNAEVVEEVAIMLAGGAAAELWNFQTNNDSDEERAYRALSYCFADRDAIDMREQIRSCVKATIGNLVWPIALLAMGLIVAGECDGFRATKVIQSTFVADPRLKECLRQVAL